MKIQEETQILYRDEQLFSSQKQLNWSLSLIITDILEF